MKKILLFMLCLILPGCMSHGATCHDFSYKYKIDCDTKTAKIIAYDGCSFKLAIPEEVEYEGVNYKVTSIGEWVFSGKNDILDVYIPKSIKSIGRNAFYGCKHLRSVSIEPGTEIISAGAFRYCSSLAVACIPKTVSKIGKAAFSGCTALSFAFYDGSKETLTLGDDNETFLKALMEESKVANVKYEENSKYRYLKTGTNEVMILEFIGKDDAADLKNDFEGMNVIMIFDFAFRGCASLKSITIPSCVTYIGKDAFKGCSSLSINCEQDNMPSRWNDEWNPDNRPVYWNGN